MESVAVLGTIVSQSERSVVEPLTHSSGFVSLRYSSMKRGGVCGEKVWGVAGCGHRMVFLG
jgi:hypothetical protein